MRDQARVGCEPSGNSQYCLRRANISFGTREAISLQRRNRERERERDNKQIPFFCFSSSASSSRSLPSSRALHINKMFSFLLIYSEQISTPYASTYTRVYARIQRVRHTHARARSNRTLQNGIGKLFFDGPVVVVVVVAVDVNGFFSLSSVSFVMPSSM